MLYLLFDLIRNWLVSTGLYSVLGVLDQVQFRALLAAGLSFTLIIALGKRTIRFLMGLKIGDAGESDAEMLRAHAKSKANVPTMGGVLICGSIFASTFLLADISTPKVLLGLFVLIWLACVGGADDWLKLTASRRGTGRQGLYAWEKLVFQLGIGLLAGYFAYRYSAVETGQALGHVLNLPFQRTYLPGAQGVAEGLIYLSLPVFVLVSVLMIAGLSNAVNITDGMDGLAGGISGVVSFALLMLALIAGSEQWAQYLLVPYVPRGDELAVLAGAMAGACLGFLWWNAAPAQVFMGDTGSLALGGLIAYIAVAVRQEIVVLIMCGVFLLEIFSVTLQVGWFKYTRVRTGTGRRIFRVAPYHHHLHMGGWAENQVVVRLWILAIIMCVVALATLKLR
ncbi:MAG: phospho-N-acetylmuramoyl-pentapeptide-transferase [Phycisphaerales bacterium]|nr:phospho-N-acetylmuramoyl-pentapeptide-transferase [Planctomycetota bacterium]MCH8508858.1 phospho-N-acetylmuramoyl-pentapeptide-transferase [Phycisphaerales bacterium]